MNKNQKILLIFIGICMLAVIGVITFNIFMPKPEIQPSDVEVSQRVVIEENVDVNKIDYEAVNVFFIGRNETNEEVYKAVKRKYNKKNDGSKLKFAIKNLIQGPTSEEINKGVYTEIPSSTELLSVTENSDNAIINLNSEFINGSGTESLYKRLYQLIKTVQINSQLPVYLYIDGKKAEVIGGEGIILTQPLGNSSLEN